jgi:hypothetical protein
MKKLRLEMDDLRVESFDASDPVPEERGTVRGQQTYGTEGPCDSDPHGHCVPSYVAPCWWTGDRMQDCYPASELNVCTDYQC